MPSDFRARPLIDVTAVRQQFERRAANFEAADFLLRDVQARLLDRMSLVRAEPKTVLDMGSGIGGALPQLHARFPQAQLWACDLAWPLLARMQREHRRSWLQRLGLAGSRSHLDVRAFCSDMAALPLPAEYLDCIWSNLSLHWHPHPDQVFQEWHRVMAPGGLLMFSVLGPYTLRELAGALRGFERPRILPFVDMHDYGDMLVQAGFQTPVMDMETLTMTYRDPASVVRDLRAFGGNPLVGREPGLLTRRWREQLLAAIESLRAPDGLIHLTVEVAFGHAWRTARAEKRAGGIVRVQDIRKSPPRAEPQ